MVLLQPISATSAYPLLPSQVVNICDLQRLALYWFHAPGLQLDNDNDIVVLEVIRYLGHVKKCNVM